MSKFYFKHEDWGEEFQPIEAFDMEDAAEKFAERYNEDGDYCLMNHSEDVLISDGTIEKVFTVYAEPTVNYSAYEKENTK